jgi:hypothetical protein
MSPVAAEKGLEPTPKLDGINPIGEVETVTSKKATLDVPPPGPGLTTVIEAVSALTTSEERIVAFIRDWLTNVVARALPFHFTTEPEASTTFLRYRQLHSFH